METPSKPQKAAPKAPRNWLARLVTWTVGLAVAATVLFVLYLAVPPAYSEARLWRGTHFADIAATAFKAGKWEDAIEKYRLAEQMSPGNLEYQRQMARASEKISLVRANELWNGIMRRPEVSNDERQDYVEFLLRIGRIDVAAEHLKRLMLSKPAPARSLSLASDFFRLRGDLETSTSFAKQALIASPEDAEIQFKLGDILAADVTPKDRLDGRRLLWGLAKTTNSMRVDAWKRLASTGELNAAEAEQILGWIQSDGLSDEQYLLVAELKSKSQPANKEQIVRSVVAKAASAPEPKLLEAVSWLNRRAAYGEALGLLPIEQAGTNLALLSVHIDSLIGLKQWDTIEHVLARTNSPIDPTVTECIRAHAATSRGDKVASDRIWAQLVSSSTNNPFKARIVAVEAERMGRKDVALDAYRHYLTDDRIGVEANRQTYRIARSLSRFDVARDAATRLARRDGTDSAAVSSMVYLNLLLKTQVRQSLETASTLLRLNPEQPNFIALTAFGYLRNDEPKKALALVESLRTPHPLLPPQWRAIVAAIMKANGRIKDQVELLESLDNSGFNRDELKLVMN
jgi:tetratricopeptide (TPR) repeat protein